MKIIQKNCLDWFIRTFLFMAMVVLIGVQGISTSFAAFGEDVEKPKPEFTRKDNVITAKLLPRGKSTKVTIGFEVKGGELTEVKALDFPAAKSAEIEVKDFRSDLFAIEVSKVPVGGEATLTIRSDYFSSSSRFFLFNDKATPAWSDANAQHKTNAGKVRDLTITVKDGGAYDVDGAANGKIVLNGGPSDPFWGYAIGTLFIRFFGVFLVLGVLMIGMMICGKFFESADKRKAQQKSLAGEREAAAQSVAKSKMDPQMVAAISLALHLELSGGKTLDSHESVSENEIEPEMVVAIMKAVQTQRS
ncbi:MAG: uncharacterized protein H6R18_1713 [Proteobacteria bacterium]|nr:uncharacterized protein [Pseudomonadota bacterium]